MNDSIDYQIITQNIASGVEPQLRLMSAAVPIWNFIIVLLAMLFVVINKQIYFQRFKMMFSALTQPSDTAKMMRENTLTVSINGLIIFLSYVALLALTMQKIVVVYSGNTILYDNLGFYFDICAFIAAFCIIQYLAGNLFGWLFGIENAITYQWVLLLLGMTAANMVMIVFGLIALFYPTKFILIVISSIILIINAIRIIRTIFAFRMYTKLNMFQIFLYFCTLEILPVIAAVTMMVRLIANDCVL